MSKLHIAEGFSLPADYATKTAAILAKRRVGKTYTGSVIAEELVRIGQPFYVLDPTGAWWGLRASADGKKPGLPVTIIGGAHGDVPLEIEAGKVIADLVVEQPSFYVVDLSLVESQAAHQRFAAAFLDRLYRAKARHREPLHGLIDEADMFAPQRPDTADIKMLGAMEAIVRRGGILGLGTTLISQRPAVVNKNVLSQVDMIIALRTIAPQDQEPIDDYVKRSATPEERKLLMGSLASLALGEAWIYGPGEDPALLKRIQIRVRNTFNSSATPKAGERRAEPRALADVDLEALKARMAATIERAKADDPKALRARIAELERELKAKPAAAPAKVERVEVPVLTAADVDRLKDTCTSALNVAQQFYEAGRAVETALGRFASAPRSMPAAARNPSPTSSRAPTPARFEPAPPRRAAAASSENGGVLTGPEQRILNAIAWLESCGIAEPEQGAVAWLARYSGPENGAYKNPRASLNTAGHVAYLPDGRIRLTDSGRAIACAPDAPATAKELQTRVLERLPGPERKILSLLLEAYPASVDSDTLAHGAGYSDGNNGAFKNPRSRLRSLGLVDYPEQGKVAARSLLFLEGA